MAEMVICPDCLKVVWANEDWPQDTDLSAVANYLKWPCPNCGQKEKFSNFRILGGTLADLRKKAEEMNLNWDPSPQFGKIEDRDYIQAIENLIKRREVK